jgi:hypothetical protein
MLDVCGAVLGELDAVGDSKRSGRDSFRFQEGGEGPAATKKGPDVAEVFECYMSLMHISSRTS